MGELEAKIRSHYDIGEDTPLEDKNTKPIPKDGKKGGGRKSQAAKEEVKEAEADAGEDAADGDEA